jgi:hypothetical protein
VSGPFCFQKQRNSGMSQSTLMVLFMDGRIQDEVLMRESIAWAGGI